MTDDVAALTISDFCADVGCGSDSIWSTLARVAAETRPSSSTARQGCGDQKECGDCAGLSHLFPQCDVRLAVRAGPAEPRNTVRSMHVTTRDHDLSYHFFTRCRCCVAPIPAVPIGRMARLPRE